MSQRTPALIAVIVGLVGVSACDSVSQSEFDAHVQEQQAALTAIENWLIGPRAPGNEQHAVNLNDWMKKVSLAICDLEHAVDEKHPDDALLPEPLCPSGPGDPKAPPPEPPDLPG